MKEADKNNRQQFQENKMLQLEQEQHQRKNTTQVNSKEKNITGSNNNKTKVEALIWRFQRSTYGKNI